MRFQCARFFCSHARPCLYLLHLVRPNPPGSARIAFYPVGNALYAFRYEDDAIFSSPLSRHTTFSYFVN